MSFCYLSYFRKSPILCVLIIVPIFVMSDSLSNSYLQFCFIASFAFVLQRHRAKPIPLVGRGFTPAAFSFLGVRHGGSKPPPYDVTTLYHKSAENTSHLPIFICVSVGETCGLPQSDTVRPYGIHPFEKPRNPCFF